MKIKQLIRYRVVWLSLLFWWGQPLSAGEVAGWVFDAEGAPLTGARVEIIRAGAPSASPVASTVTDLNGRYRLPTPPEPVEVRVLVDGHVEMRYRAEVFFTRTEVPPVFPRREKPVEVFVRDTEGRPVVGARVSARCPTGNDHGIHWEAARRVVDTDGEGRARLSRPSDSAVLVRARAAGLASSRELSVMDTAEIRLGPASSTETEAADLLPVSGRVVDRATGRPLVGAVVWGPDVPQITRMDSEGQFSMDIQPRSGRYAFRVSAPGFGSAYVFQRLDGIGEGPFHELEMSLDRYVTGRVVDASGEPVSGVALWWKECERCPTPRVPRRWTESNGRFTLGPFVEGETVEVEGERDGYGPIELRIEALSGTSPLIVRLGPGTTVTGRLVDPDGKPIARARVELEEARDMATGLPADPRHYLADTDTDGRFRFPHLSARAHTLTTSAPSHAPIQQTVHLDDDAVDLGDLVLDPTLELRGRVVDPDGNPLPEIRVALSRNGYLGPLLDTEAAPDHALYDETRTDSQGTFRFGELISGETVAVVATRPGSAPPVERLPLDLASPPAPLTLVLEPAARLHGRVEGPDGRPIRGTKVRLIRPWPSNDPEETHPLFVELTPEDDGRFEVHHLPLGRWTLQLMPEWGVPKLVETHVELRRGETVGPVRITGPTRTEISGNVRRPYGRSVGGARVEVRYPVEGTDRPRDEVQKATTGPDGAYRVVLWHDGFVTVTASHPEHGWARRELPLVEAAHRVDLDLEDALRIEVEVVSEVTGKPVARAWAMWQRRRGTGDNGPAGSWTDENGRAILRLDTPGRFVVSASAEGYLPASGGELYVGRGDTKIVRIALPEN